LEIVGQKLTFRHKLITNLYFSSSTVTEWACLQEENYVNRINEPVSCSQQPPSPLEVRIMFFYQAEITSKVFT